MIAYAIVAPRFDSRVLPGYPRSVPKLRRHAVNFHLGVLVVGVRSDRALNHLAYRLRLAADDVIVTNGAQQGLDLIGRVLITPGAVVAVEEPGYPPARDLFASLAVVPTVATCFGKQMVRYAMSRTDAEDDACAVQSIGDVFASSLYSNVVGASANANPISVCAEPTFSGLYAI